MKAPKRLTMLLVLSAAFLASCSIGGQSSASSNTSGETSSATTASETTTTEPASSSSSTKTSSGTSSGESSSDASSKTSSGASSNSTSMGTSSGSSLGEFVIETSDGAYSVSNNVVTISSGGTYVLSGALAGQIYVSAADTDEVELDLNGVSITYGENSPIYVASADEVKIKAQKGTENYVTDTRAEQTTDDETQGGGAIYAKADLKLVGQGSLNVTGTYNNGIHTTKDLKIKKQTLVVQAPNNAIKGNDSVTITSGTITAISTAGDAIKTSSTDLSPSSVQRGSVDISGGDLTLYAGGDGIDAAYNVSIYDGTDEDDPTVTTIPNITIYTNKYSKYSDSSVLSAYTGTVSSLEYGWGGPGGGGPGGGGPGGGGMSEGNSDKADGSAKGIKAANAIYVSGGVTNISAYDDGLHANYGDTFESGAKGVGDVEISGGTINLSVSDDGVHADRYLRISGGTTTISDSHEGIEGNQIYITGGTTISYADDDSVNAASGTTTAGLSAAINVSGGYLFACVPTSGDTDSIDSNGTYTQTGGTVITCGPNNMNAGALDCDGTVSVKGGTLAVFGYAGNVSSSGVTKSSKSGTYGGKAYTLTFASGSVTTQKLTSSNYANCTCYSVLGSLSSIA